MSWFSKMKIGSKLGMGFGAVLVLVVILGVFSVMQLSKINGSTVDIASNWLPSVETLAGLRFESASARRWELGHILNPDKAQAQAKLDGAIAAIGDAQKNTSPSSAPMTNAVSTNNTVPHGTNTCKCRGAF